MKKKKLSIKKETIAKLELKGDIMGGYTGYKSCNLCLATEEPGCVSEILACPSDNCVSDKCPSNGYPYDSCTCVPSYPCPY